MSQRNEQFFDKFAESYRDVHTKSIKKISGTDSFYFAEYKVKEIKRFESGHFGRFLDFGCGDGVTEFFLTYYLPLFELVGIDVSEKSIEEAKKRKIPNALFKHFDGNRIPFPDSSFDVVFAAGVLHHIKKDMHFSVVGEMYRVLKPGGRLYIFEHNPINPFTQYLVKTCEFDKDVNLITSGYCKSLLQKTNFFVTDIAFNIFFPRYSFFKWFIKLEKYLTRIPLGGQYFIRSFKTAKN